MRNNPKKTSPLKWMLRRYAFLAVAVFLITFAVFPMQGMMRILSVREGIESLAEPIAVSTAVYYTRELTRDFVYSPLNLEILCALFGGMGFACAMVLLRSHFSRKQAMMYAGLPMTRIRSFALRTAVFGIWGLLPMAVCLAIHPLMVQANGLGTYFNLQIYFSRAAAALLITLYGYAAGALCAMIFGTVWSAALGGVLLIGSAEVAFYCWINIAGWYLNTLCVKETIRELMRFSPAYSLYKSFYQPDAFMGWPGIIATLIFGALAAFACRSVRPENAGHTLNLKGLEPVLMAWISLLGGTVGAVVLCLYLSAEPVVFSGILLGVLLTWILVRMLVDQRIRVSLKGWMIPAAAAALMLLTCLGLRGDWMGFDRYTARPEELQAVEIWDEMSEKQAKRFEDPESMRACLEWVEQAREEELKSHAETPYDPFRYADCVVAFRKKNGGRVLRQYHYPRDRQAVLPALRVMAKAWGAQQSEEIPELDSAGWYPAISEFGLNGAEFKDVYGFNPDAPRQGRLNPKKLREALQADLRERTLERMQEPTILRVYLQGENPVFSTDGYQYLTYNIKPQDRHTLELILGEDADQWIRFVRGGFAQGGEAVVFLCEYAEGENEERTLKSYHRLETEEAVRSWIARTIQCEESLFRCQVDPDRSIAVYMLPSLRNLADYGELEEDPDDPEVLARLPEIENIWGNYYDVMASDL